MKKKTMAPVAGKTAGSSTEKLASTPQAELQEKHYVFPLGKANFIIMGIAAAMIVVGFMLISGGGSENGNFNPDVFSTTRIVVGPTLAFLGFVAMGVGIMWSGWKKK